MDAAVGPPSDGLRCTAHKNVAEIGRPDWGRVCGAADVDCSFDYVLFLESLDPDRRIALVCRDAGGRPCGAITAVGSSADTTLFNRPIELLTSPQFLRMGPAFEADNAADDSAASDEIRSAAAELLGEAKPASPVEDVLQTVGDRLDDDLCPTLVVRDLFSSRAMVAPDAGNARIAVVRALVDSAIDWARDAGFRSVTLPFVREADAVLAEALGAAKFHEFRLTASPVIDLAGCTGLDAYLACFHGRRRKHILAEIRDFERSGLQVRELPAAEAAGPLAELEVSTSRRHGGDLPYDLVYRSNLDIAQRLGDAVRVWGCFERDELISFSMIIASRSSFLALAYGADYDQPATTDSYAQLMYFAPIEAAIRAGAQRYELGFEDFVPKLRHGADLGVRRAWIRAVDDRTHQAVGGWLQVVRDRNDRFFQSLLTRYPAPP